MPQSSIRVHHVIFLTTDHPSIIVSFAHHHHHQIEIQPRNTMNSTPGLVATFVIRSSDQVTASRDNRELTPVALYVPISSFLILFGLWYSYRKEQQELGVQAEKEGVTEETGLLAGSRPSKERRRSSVVSIEQAFSRRSEVNRRMSAQVMGLTAFDTKQEQELSEQLQHDLEEWQQLAEMDYDDDEDVPN